MVAFPQILLRFIAIPIASLSLIASASAATLIELDFQNLTGSTTTGTVAAGASSLFTLTNVTSSNPSINTTGSTGVNGNSDVSTGYYSNARSPNTNGVLVATNTAGTGSNAEWRDYFGTGWGTATVATIFKPDFTTLSPGSRAYLFSSGYTGSSAVAMSLGINDDETLRLGFGSGSNLVLNLNTAVLTWDPAKSYFIAASWSADAAIPQTVSIFIREVGAESGTLTTSSGTLANSISISRAPVIGNIENTAGASGAMGGDMAYFLATDDYTTTTGGYNAIYTALIPEPSTYALLFGSLGMAAIFFRSRSRARRSVG